MNTVILVSRTKAQSRGLLVAILVALLGAAAGGLAWASIRGPAITGDSNAIDPQAYTDQTTSVPQATDPQAALDSTLKGLDSGVFLSVRLGDPPSKSDRPGLWLYATVQGSSLKVGGDVAAAWEADLAQGAVADRLAQGYSDLSSVVSGSSIDFESSDGTVTPVTGGAGDVVTSQSFVGGSDESIISSVDSVLLKYSLTPTEVRVLHPLQPAVSVVATVKDPAQINGQFEEIWNAIEGSPMQYEGLYLEIDSADGSPIVCSSADYRNGSGRLWIDPKFDSDIGEGH
jgi:hypothetical protein